MGRVRLNVGGVIHECDEETLRRASAETVFFEQLLSPDWMDHESIFIDRNGATFSYILDYLRRGYVNFGGHIPAVVQDISGEAEFFCLKSLQNAAEAYLDKERNDALERQMNLADVAMRHYTAESPAMRGIPGFPTSPVRVSPAATETVQWPSVLMRDVALPHHEDNTPERGRGSPSPAGGSPARLEVQGRQLPFLPRTVDPPTPREYEAFRRAQINDMPSPPISPMEAFPLERTPFSLDEDF
eukprot:Polyplicarium_translucidae@DN3342_c2_g2_i3.p1